MLRHGKLAKSIRTDRWRYTEWDEGRRGIELYDHDRDPFELTNLARNSKYSRTLTELKRLIPQPAVKP
jgi:iduronate 2-sulfatase